MKSILKIVAVSTVVLGTTALATDSPPSGYEASISNGDIVGGLHTTQSVSAGRAEWRCSPNNSSCSTRTGTIYFKREFKVNGGADISIAQFLNVQGSGTTGSSEPISQLTVDDQRNGTYRVSIEQGNYDCGFRLTKKQWYSLEAGIGPGGVGWFKVGGNWCQRPAGRRSAGKPEVDNYSGTNNYYFKYGAYNAAGNSVASSVSWR